MNINKRKKRGEKIILILKELNGLTVPTFTHVHQLKKEEKKEEREWEVKVYFHGGGEGDVGSDEWGIKRQWGSVFHPF